MGRLTRNSTPPSTHTMPQRPLTSKVRRGVALCLVTSASNGNVSCTAADRSMIESFSGVELEAFIKKMREIPPKRKQPAAEQADDLVRDLMAENARLQQALEDAKKEASATIAHLEGEKANLHMQVQSHEAIAKSGQTEIARLNGELQASLEKANEAMEAAKVDQSTILSLDERLARAEDTRESLCAINREYAAQNAAGEVKVAEQQRVIDSLLA